MLLPIITVLTLEPYTTQLLRCPHTCSEQYLGLVTNSSFLILGSILYSKWGVAAETQTSKSNIKGGHFLPLNRGCKVNAEGFLSCKLMSWFKFSASFQTLNSSQFTLSTQLTIPNYHVILPYRPSTTVSLETYPLIH